MTEEIDRERLVEALLCGEIDPDDPRVRACVDGDQEFADEVHTLMATRDLLDRAGHEELTVLSEDPVANAPRKPRLAGWLALAAAGLVVGVLIWANRSSPQATRFLGGEVRIAAPANPGGEFAFDFAVPPGGWFEVTVHQEGAEQDTLPIETSGELQQPRWTPRRDWPSVVTVMVTAYDAQGDRVAEGRLRYAH